MPIRDPRFLNVSERRNTNFRHENNVSVAREFDPRDVESFQTCAQLIAPVVINAWLLALVGESEEERDRSAADLRSAGIPVKIPGDEAPERTVELAGTPAARGIAIGSVYVVRSASANAFGWRFANPAIRGPAPACARFYPFARRRRPCGR